MNKDEIYKLAKSLADKINDEDLIKAKIVLCYTGGHEIIYKLDELVEEFEDDEEEDDQDDQSYAPTRRRRYDDEEDED